MSRTDIEALRLDLLKGPWNERGRRIIKARMEKLGLTYEDLHFELRLAGWDHSYSTMRRWLDENDPAKPDVDEVVVLTEVIGAIPGFLNSPDDVGQRIPVMADYAA